VGARWSSRRGLAARSAPSFLLLVVDTGVGATAMPPAGRRDRERLPGGSLRSC